MVLFHGETCFVFFNSWGYACASRIFPRPREEIGTPERRDTSGLQARSNRSSSHLLHDPDSQHFSNISPPPSHPSAESPILPRSMPSTRASDLVIGIEKPIIFWRWYRVFFPSRRLGIFFGLPSGLLKSLTGLSIIKFDTAFGLTLQPKWSGMRLRGNVWLLSSSPGPFPRATYCNSTAAVVYRYSYSCIYTWIFPKQPYKSIDVWLTQEPLHGLGTT